MAVEVEFIDEEFSNGVRFITPRQVHVPWDQGAVLQVTHILHEPGGCRHLYRLHLQMGVWVANFHQQVSRRKRRRRWWQRRRRWKGLQGWRRRGGGGRLAGREGGDTRGVVAFSMPSAAATKATWRVFAGSRMVVPCQVDEAPSLSGLVECSEIRSRWP